VFSREEEVDDEVDAERPDKCREIRECPAYSASICWFSGVSCFCFCAVIRGWKTLSL
jgi:hypothetical protein